MSFPVAGIGASAGGLDAIVGLLGGLPTPTGTAFVLVQHLDPAHGSLLTEILTKKIPLTVIQAEDGMILEPEHLYVIPPNATLTLVNGALCLRGRESSEERHRPIDLLFNSLAEECGHNAIGVVLSGTGSDGARGVQRIKETGGITFAQDIASAQFDGMPKSAIETGCVDFVLPPIEIARKLAKISQHPYLNSAAWGSGELQPVPENQLTDVFRVLLAKCPVDFSHYKRSTIQQRIARRVALHHLKGLEDYVDLLREDPAEVQALCRDFLIGVTGFFRDPDSFAGLVETVFPKLINGRSSTDTLRIWVPGCATGEEVYSIAISFIEFWGNRINAPAIQIFGTDLSEAAIQTARRGVYPEGIVREVSSERLQRFFGKLDRHYQIAKPVRDLCLFAQQDVAYDPPFSRLDLVSCRNVLIYLDQELQQRVVRFFYYALKPNGFLMLGPSETIGQYSNLFRLMDTRHRIYRREALAGPSNVESEPVWNASPRTPGDRAVVVVPAVVEKDRAQRETERLLARFAPACILVEDNLNILYFHGNTDRYLQHADGRASLNLQKLARPGLLIQLSAAIQQARTEGAPVRREAVSVEMPDGIGKLDFQVIPLKMPDLETPFYVILFEDPSPHHKQPKQGKRLFKWLANLPGGAVVAQTNEGAPLLQRELEATREYLKTIIEQHESAKEELHSANEELATTNEEFQSANEELETAKEELEATNEELATTNEELATTNDELRNRNRDLNELNESLRQSSDYREAIIETMRESLLVLDGDLRVKKANHAFYELFETRPEETEGCFLYNLAGGRWDIPPLRKLLEEVLPKNVVLRDYEVSQSFPWIGDRTLVLNARRLPGDEQRNEMILLAIEDVSEHASALYAIRDRRKDEFLAMLAHELRNPLAPICYAMRLLRMGDVSTATAKQYDIIDRQLEDLVRLVDDLLDVGRITRGDIVLKKQVVYLVDIVHQVVEQTRQQIDEKKQQLDLSLPATPLCIDADPIRLKQVISNLLSNAAKYTDPGGRIALTLDRQDGAALLRVHDTGIGMDSETLHHVFELFYQADTAFSRTRGGLGVGLTLVRRLVELHGGRIDAYSEGLGKGSEFTVRLPLISAADGPVQSVEMPPTELPPVPSGGRRILIVDDNADTAETVALLVQSWGYKTAIANDATAAIEVAKSFRPDIALLDIGLPRMNGFELARSLRKLPESAKILLIAITGYGREQDREAAHLAGFNHYMVKPVDVDRLRALLASFD
jgi:two-component system, chemotaxis family, CheB/CheR fusion protein